VSRPDRPARDLALLDAVDGCAREAFSGPLWRICRSGRDPLQGGPSRSRWCDGSFDVLYTSLERDGAVAEIHALLSLQPVFPSQLSWIVHRLSVRAKSVLRVAEISALAPFGVDAASYRDRTYSRTQALAEAAYFLGFDGMIVPSARWQCLNAVLFSSRIPPADLALDASDDTSVDWSDWKRRQFDERADQVRGLTAGRKQTPSEALLRKSREDR
jgi:hypothetical protein